MEGTVNERIKILVDQLASGNKSSFARSIGISNQSLGEIIGGRQSAPSFAALQKIFTSFPQVRMEWLILGSGPMLHADEASSGKTLDPFAGAGVARQAATTPISWAQWEEIQAQVSEVTKRLNAIDEEASELAVARDAEAVVYALTGEPNPKLPYDGLLTVRLGLSEQEARELIESEKLEAWCPGEPGPHANWHASEADVRSFLRWTPGEQRRAIRKGRKPQK